jgi:nitrile hydratase
MNGIHDLGGMHGMGPINPEKNEPVFHARWEARLVGMIITMFSRSDFKSDGFRYEIESLPPVDYLGMSYYQRWIPVLSNLLVKAGFVTRAELDSGKAAPGSAKIAPAPNAPARSSEPAPGAAPRFVVGQTVRARKINPTGHTRLPRYTRGRVGTIERDNGVQDFPDTSAHGLGDKRQHVYSVKFTARELWGEQASARDSVYVDLWDDYLETA